MRKSTRILFAVIITILGIKYLPAIESGLVYADDSPKLTITANGGTDVNVFRDAGLTVSIKFGDEEIGPSAIDENTVSSVKELKDVNPAEGKLLINSSSPLVISVSKTGHTDTTGAWTSPRLQYQIAGIGDSTLTVKYLKDSKTYTASCKVSVSNNINGICGMVNVAGLRDEYEYKQGGVCPEFILSYGSGASRIVYEKDKDYTAIYENNTEVGYGKLTIKGINKYDGTIVHKFRIYERPIEDSFLKNNFTDEAYTGSPITKELTMEDGPVKLVENKEYIVKYANNINVGTATVTLTGIGNYTGEFSREIKIIPKGISTNTVVTLSKSKYIYTGGECKPKVTVVYRNPKTREDIALVENESYTVSYVNNIHAGSAKVTVSLIGNYKGSVEKKFKIYRRTIKEIKINKSVVRYTGKECFVDYKVYDDRDEEVPASSLDVSFNNNKKVGKAELTVKAKGDYKNAITINYDIRAMAKKSSYTIKKGKKVDLKVKSNDRVKYTASKNGIVKISKKGVVRGLKKGTVKITIESGGYKSTTKVKVK